MSIWVIVVFIIPFGPLVPLFTVVAPAIPSIVTITVTVSVTASGRRV